LKLTERQKREIKEIVEECVILSLMNKGDIRTDEKSESVLTAYSEEEKYLQMGYKKRGYLALYPDYGKLYCSHVSRTPKDAKFSLIKEYFKEKYGLKEKGEEDIEE